MVTDMIIFGKDLMDNVKRVIPSELDSLSDEIDGIAIELDALIDENNDDRDFIDDMLSDLKAYARDLYEISDMLKTQTTPRTITRDKRKHKKGA
jgi:hypothetical protein